MKSNWVNNSISSSLNRYEYMILTNHYIMGRKNIKKKKSPTLYKIHGERNQWGQNPAPVGGNCGIDSIINILSLDQVTET